MVIDVRNSRTRMVLAFALAIALHEVLLGVLHAPARPRDREDQAPATRIAIETMPPTPRPTVRPTPRPTPPPTPPPRVTVPPRVTPAPVPQIAGRAKGHPAKHRGGGAHRAIAKAPTGHYANPHAAGSGTGTSVGHGSGNTPGTGGGLAGNGTGTSGNGNGGVNADTPCGVVEFIPFAPPEYHNGTAYEPIKAKVTFADGHKEDERFPYKWVYPNGEQTDPWSNTNLAKGDFPVIVQTPPPGTDPATLPPLIQYILQHSRADGTTQLIDCPKGQG